MNKYGLRYILLGLLLVSSNAIALESDIWQQLRKGGLVILLRHAEVDAVRQSSALNEDDLSCAGQLNLNAHGIQQAHQLKQVIHKQKIPVGEVMASPLCRTRDTASIAFGHHQVWPLLVESTEPNQAARVASIAHRIGGYHGHNNLVLVTHQPIIDALTLELVDWATMVIVKPDGKGGFSVIKKITPQEWQAAH